MVDRATTKIKFVILCRKIIFFNFDRTLPCVSSVPEKYRNLVNDFANFERARYKLDQPSWLGDPVPAQYTRTTRRFTIPISPIASSHPCIVAIVPRSTDYRVLFLVWQNCGNSVALNCSLCFSFSFIHYFAQL